MKHAPTESSVGVLYYKIPDQFYLSSSSIEDREIRAHELICMLADYISM